MKHVKTTRRSFLSTTAKGMGVLGLSSSLIDSIVLQILNKACAQTLTKEIYYVHVSLAGGLPRWQFDLPLKPLSNSTFRAAKFGTVIEGSPGNYSVQYVTKPYTISNTQKVNLAPVWFMNSSGKKFTDLLPNMAMIRGVDMEINSHPISNGRQVAPNIGGYSISGVTADAANLPLPGVLQNGTIGDSASNVFRSTRGLAGLSFNHKTANPVGTLLRAFKPLNPAAEFTKSDWQSAREQVQTRFDEYALAMGVHSSSLAEAYSSAEELVSKGIINLQDDYPALKDKYRDLISDAVFPGSGALSAYFPNTITVDASSRSFQLVQNTNIQTSNLWDVLGNSTFPEAMAEGFAVAELMIKNNLSSSYVISVPGWEKLRIGGTVSSPTLVTISNDHHFVGQYPETLLTTLQYRALLSCLCEFTERLGDKFNKTVIHISSEWNRSPRADGTGSDHGVTGSNVSLISGMIQGPVVIGNIRADSGLPLYPGTWGVAAPWRFDDNLTRPFVVTDVTRTITGMLGVRDVVNNGYPLLKINSGGKWVAVRNEAQNV
ncbi:MAG: hypothetical protein AB7G93_09710 [Bdellovibrionales bacterium]